MKNDRHVQLYMFAGAWLSLVAMVIGGSLLLPVAPEGATQSTALLYKFALNDAPKKEHKAPVNGRALIANLESMELSLYEDAALVKTFPILSKGRPGTAWETPSGAYTIQTKEVNHLSSIGGTWMPYSMQFYGNFFIHGWPTYPNGEDVPKGYSGGCIRLDTDDALEVYKFTPKGTKIVVLNSVRQSAFATSSRYYLHGSGVPPTISASSFTIQDVETGKILWEKNAYELKNPKELSLLVTALTALETVNQYKSIHMSELLLGPGVAKKHQIGDADLVPIGSLIYPLLFDKSDTAAKIFSLDHGSKYFVRSMNEKAQAIGMDVTEFSGPLSTDNATTSVRDLATLLRYVDTQKHFLVDVLTKKEQTLSAKNGDDRYTWTNKDPILLMGDASYRGGMMSVDQSGVGGAMLLYDLPLSEFGSRKIAFVLLDSIDIPGDVATLREFIQDHFVYGIENESGAFIREDDEPTPGLMKRAKELIDLEQLLKDEVQYEREV